MTVKDLRKALDKLPEDAHVKVTVDDVIFGAWAESVGQDYDWNDEPTDEVTIYAVAP